MKYVSHILAATAFLLFLARADTMVPGASPCTGTAGANCSYPGDPQCCHEADEMAPEPRDGDVDLDVWKAGQSTQTNKERWHRLSAIDMSVDFDDMDVRQAQVSKLMEYVTGVGFVALTDIPGFDEQELLRASESFYHDLTEEDRKSLMLRHFNNENENRILGFFPLLPNDKSHKEIYDMGRPFADFSTEELAAFPGYEEAPWLKNDPENKHLWIYETFQKYWRIMYKTCVIITSLLAEGLGKAPDYFEPWFNDGCSSTFRAIHYLPRDHERAADSHELDAESAKLVTPEHSDSGFMTLLTTFDYPGLQVEIDGEYKSIKPVPKGLIMNLGALLSKLSEGKVKATQHRVLDIGRERYSVPFFFQPKYTAVLWPDMLESERKYIEDKEFDQRMIAEGKLEDNYVNWGQYVLLRMSKSYKEWQGFVVPDGVNIPDDLQIVY